MTTIKKELIDKLNTIIDTRLFNAKQAMDSAADSRDNETKSSVGDKYETGRAMMQEEYDRSKVSYLKAKQLQSALKEIKLSDQKTVVTGALVHTNGGKFFISIGLGKIEITDLAVFCISKESPIGKAMLNKSESSTFLFNGKIHNIVKIE